MADLHTCAAAGFSLAQSAGAMQLVMGFIEVY